MCRYVIVVVVDQQQQLNKTTTPPNNQHAPTSLKEKIDEGYFAKWPGDHYRAADRKTNQKGDLRHTCRQNNTSE
jgi:hypothetical protein